VRGGSCASRSGRGAPHPAYLVLAAALALAGCGERVGEYLPVSAIARGGFVGDDRTVAEVHGQDVRLWGFVDHGNLYGDAEAASGSDGGFMKNSG
jgi:predicted small lipoprotein YifL